MRKSGAYEARLCQIFGFGKGVSLDNLVKFGSLPQGSSSKKISKYGLHLLRLCQGRIYEALYYDPTKFSRLMPIMGTIDRRLVIRFEKRLDLLSDLRKKNLVGESEFRSAIGHIQKEVLWYLALVSATKSKEVGIINVLPSAIWLKGLSDNEKVDALLSNDFNAFIKNLKIESKQQAKGFIRELEELSSIQTKLARLLFELEK